MDNKWTEDMNHFKFNKDTFDFNNYEEVFDYVKNSRKDQLIKNVSKIGDIAYQFTISLTNDSEYGLNDYNLFIYFDYAGEYIWNTEVLFEKLDDITNNGNIKTEILYSYKEIDEGNYTDPSDIIDELNKRKHNK